MKPARDGNQHGSRIIEVAPQLIRHSATGGWGLYILLIAAVAYSLLARLYEPFPGDVALIQRVQTWQHPVTSAFMEAMSRIGKSAVLIALAGIAVLGLRLAHRRREWLAAAGVLVILVLNPILQMLVDRSRPSAQVVGANAHLRGLSFPSGHAYQSFVLFGFFIYLAAILISKRRLRRTVQAFLALLILAIGASRIYLGAHWPSDILGSYLLGAFFLALLVRAHQAPSSDLQRS